MNFTKEIVLKRQGQKLDSLEVHDIACKVGEIVIMGGVRRSAMISLSDLGDEKLRHAKDGQFWNTAPQRIMSNNSAVYEVKPSSQDFLKEWTSLALSGSGERGIFNRGGLLQQLPQRRIDAFDEGNPYDWGTNPCGEITLRSKQFCNLTSIVIREEDTVETMLEKIELASILGTFQATLTDFPYLSKEWAENCRKEALLGVSLTGYFDNALAREEANLVLMRDKAVEINKVFAERFGINQSTCVTCIKPSGNSSQLLDTASGMHPRYSHFYIRRVRVSSTDPIYKMMKDQGIPCKPEVGQTEESATSWVLEFPVKAPEGAIVKDDVSAIEMLEEWKKLKVSFTEHNPSVTIYVGNDEWISVANWVYENWDIVGGLSFLPRSDFVYQLAPYEEITKEQYEQMAGQISEIDFSKLVVYENEDQTQGSKELACAGGNCEI
jgi:ribonucleoside-diphosphate reductase alpha chain